MILFSLASSKVYEEEGEEEEEEEEEKEKENDKHEDIEREGESTLNLAIQRQLFNSCCSRINI